MSVEATIEIDFSDLTSLTLEVTRPANVLLEPGTLWHIIVDLPSLVDLHGPVTSLVFTAEVIAVVPLPASAWALVAGLAFLGMRCSRLTNVSISN